VGVAADVAQDAVHAQQLAPGAEKDEQIWFPKEA
jgi:hypothetical protein